MRNLMCVLIAAATGVSAGWALAQADSPPASAESAAASDGAVELSGEDKAFWRMHWRTYAALYAEVDGEYYLCPNFEARYPSSEHVTENEWRARNTQVQRSISYGMVRTRKYVPERDEAIVAATRLPSVSVGQYGHIDSAVVVEVKGPQEMIVTDVWLLDADAVAKQKQAYVDAGDRILAKQEARNDAIDRQLQSLVDAGSWVTTTGEAARRPQITEQDIREEIDKRFEQRDRIVSQQSNLRSVRLRVLGYPTRGLTPGQRWNGGGGLGPQLVIASDPRPQPVDVRRTYSTAQPMLTAINASAFERSLSEQQFTKMLADRGMTQRDFVTTARGLMRQYGKEAHVHILEELETALVEHQKKLAAEAAALAAKSTKSSAEKAAATAAREDWFKNKYSKGDKGEATADNPAEATKTREPNWFEKKYGLVKKRDEGAASAETKANADASDDAAKKGESKSPSFYEILKQRAQDAKKKDDSPADPPKQPD